MMQWRREVNPCFRGVEITIFRFSDHPIVKQFSCNSNAVVELELETNWLCIHFDAQKAIRFHSLIDAVMKNCSPMQLIGCKV